MELAQLFKLLTLFAVKQASKISDKQVSRRGRETEKELARTQPMPKVTRLGTNDLLKSSFDEVASMRSEHTSTVCMLNLHLMNMHISVFSRDIFRIISIECTDGALQNSHYTIVTINIKHKHTLTITNITSSN